MVTSRPGLSPRVQFFGLLILLAPLFAGLQHLVGDRSPVAEARSASQRAPLAAPPTERVVERVVERIIYVPVPADEVREGQTSVPIRTVPGPADGTPPSPGQLPTGLDTGRIGPVEASGSTDAAVGQTPGTRPGNETR